MGFEYIAKGIPKRFDLAKVADALRASGILTVVLVPPDRLVAQYSSRPASSWEEDVMLSLEGERLYICFHTGTAQQRNQVLNHLITAMQEGGISARFEEL